MLITNNLKSNAVNKMSRQNEILGPFRIPPFVARTINYLRSPQTVERWKTRGFNMATGYYWSFQWDRNLYL